MGELVRQYAAQHIGVQAAVVQTIEQGAAHEDVVTTKDISVSTHIVAPR